MFLPPPIPVRRRRSCSQWVIDCVPQFVPATRHEVICRKREIPRFGAGLPKKKILGLGAWMESPAVPNWGRHPTHSGSFMDLQIRITG